MKKTVNQLINRIQNLSLQYRSDDVVGITIGEAHSLCLKIVQLRQELETTRGKLAREKQLSTAIYAQAMLDCDENKYEERV